jgi:hypothetical protein
MQVLPFVKPGALVLVVEDLEAVDPAQHHGKPDACDDDARPIRSRGRLEQLADLGDCSTLPW